MMCQICNEPYSDKWILLFSDDKGNKEELAGHEDCLRPLKIKADEIERKLNKSLSVDQMLKKLNIKR
jgi:hypothetical protein